MPGVKGLDKLLIISLGSSPWIGKSCYLVILGERYSFMLDCGLNTSASGDGQYPNFSNAWVSAEIGKAMRSRACPGQDGFAGERRGGPDLGDLGADRDVRDGSQGGGLYPNYLAYPGEPDYTMVGAGALSSAPELSGAPQPSYLGADYSAAPAGAAPSRKYEYSFSTDLDFIVLTHAHIDHSGSVVRFREVHPTYRNPIYCTTATQFLMPSVFMDNIRVSENKDGGSRERKNTEQESQEMERRVRATCAQLEGVPANSSFRPLPGDDLTVTLSSAGHVLGASFVTVAKPGLAKIVYTGDYDTSTRVSLGAAFPPDCAKGADVFITETTYCNICRRPSFYREALQLADIAETMRSGGCVSVASSAVGLGQAHCVQLYDLWKRLQLPIGRLYFAKGLMDVMSRAMRALGSHAYDAAPLTGLPFAFRAQAYDQEIFRRRKRGLEARGARSYGPPGRPRQFGGAGAPEPGFRADSRGELGAEPGSGPRGPQPRIPTEYYTSNYCTVSPPNQLRSGVSLDCFMNMCPDPSSLFCLSGHAPVLANNWRVVNRTAVAIKSDFMAHTKPIRCRTTNTSFNAHVDFHGICRLISYLDPRMVMLVHNSSADKTMWYKHLISKKDGDESRLNPGGRQVLCGNDADPVFIMPLGRPRGEPDFGLGEQSSYLEMLRPRARGGGGEESRDGGRKRAGSPDGADASSMRSASGAQPRPAASVSARQGVDTSPGPSDCIPRVDLAAGEAPFCSDEAWRSEVLRVAKEILKAGIPVSVHAADSDTVTAQAGPCQLQFRRGSVRITYARPHTSPTMGEPQSQNDLATLPSDCPLLAQIPGPVRDVLRVVLLGGERADA